MAGDTQFRPIGSAAAPADWVIPSSLDILLKACFAHFDGSGAGAAFVPTLEIISDSGDVALEIPMDSQVAGGSSVEATWAPFLRGQQAAAAASTGAWAWLSGAAVTIATTGTTRLTTDHTTFYTNSPSVFDVHQNAGLSNIYGIRFLTQGHYLLSCNFTPTTQPAASSEYELVELSAGGADADYFGGPMAIFYPATGSQTDEGVADLIRLQTASVAASGLPTLPLVCGITVAGTMSATFHGSVQYIVQQLDTDGTLLT